MTRVPGKFGVGPGWFLDVPRDRAAGGGLIFLNALLPSSFLFEPKALGKHVVVQLVRTQQNPTLTVRA